MKNFSFSILAGFLIIYLSSCATGPTTPAKMESAKPTSSTLDMYKCADGTTRQGFLFPTAIGDAPCATGVQTCTSGKWTGPVLYDSCGSFSKSCGGSPHGSAVSGYLQPTSPKGVPCTPAIKTCIDGSWVGPEVFPSCMELQF